MRIDVHAHIIPESFVEVSPSEREEGVYNVRFTDETSGEVLYTARSRGSNFIAEQMYSTERRLSDMHERGIDMHALSVPTSNLFYSMEAEKALKVARATNNGFAALVSQHPDHFVALASVPLQTPDGAARELERELKRHPEDPNAKVDVGSEESMDASDPTAAAQPGQTDEPVPSSGFPK